MKRRRDNPYQAPRADVGQTPLDTGTSRPTRSATLLRWLALPLVLVLAQALPSWLAFALFRLATPLLESVDTLVVLHSVIAAAGGIGAATWVWSGSVVAPLRRVWFPWVVFALGGLVALAMALGFTGRSISGYAVAASLASGAVTAYFISQSPKWQAPDELR